MKYFYLPRRRATLLGERLALLDLLVGSITFSRNSSLVNKWSTTLRLHFMVFLPPKSVTRFLPL